MPLIERSKLVLTSSRELALLFNESPVFWRPYPRIDPIHKQAYDLFSYQFSPTLTNTNIFNSRIFSNNVVSLALKLLPECNLDLLEVFYDDFP